MSGFLLHRARLGLPLLAVLLSTTAATSQECWTLSAHNTGNASEVTSWLPGDGSWRRVYLDWIPDVRTNDVLLVESQLQVTNDTGVNMGVWCQARLSDALYGWGVEITEAAGRNVTPDMHHDQRSVSGTKVVEEVPRGDGYKLVSIYCRSAGRGSGVSVDADYGRLSVLHFRGP